MADTPAKFYKVEAVIKPFKLDEVKDRLEASGFIGMTVIEARGKGERKGHSELYRGSEYTIDFLSKVKLEIIVEGEVASKKVAEIISQSARTGSLGDGPVLIYELNSAVHISDGRPYIS